MTSARKRVPIQGGRPIRAATTEGGDTITGLGAVVRNRETTAMTVVVGEIYTEWLRYAYALSTSLWAHLLAYATVPGLVAAVVIAAARQLRASAAGGHREESNVATSTTTQRAHTCAAELHTFISDE